MEQLFKLPISIRSQFRAVQVVSDAAGIMLYDKDVEAYVVIEKIIESHEFRVIDSMYPDDSVPFPDYSLVIQQLEHREAAGLERFVHRSKRSPDV